MGLTSLETASTHEPKMEEITEKYSNHYYLLEEISGELRHYLDNNAYDEKRLATIESRLNELQMLMRKYGDTVSDILDYAAKIALITYKSCSKINKSHSKIIKRPLYRKSRL